MSWSQTIGDNIRRWRLARDISQETLAGEADISMRHLGRIERGEGNPTVNVLERLAGVLGISWQDLFEQHPHAG